MTALDRGPAVDDALPPLNLRHPFRRSSAIEHGISDRRLRSPEFRQIYRGVHVAASVPVTPTLRARASLAIAPTGSVVSHQSAARLWGGVVPEGATVHVTIPMGTRFTRTGIRAHLGETHTDTAARQGIRLTSPTRTFVDLAPALGLLDLVTLGDSLVKARQVTPEQLIAACAVLRGRYAAHARRAARLVRCGVASPMETRVRLLMVLAGLPEPSIDHQLNHPDGSLQYRLDLSFPKVRLAIEYDGAHHDLPGQRGPDLIRREDLEGQGWVFVVIVANQLLGDPAGVLARIVGAMERCGMPVSPLREEWRRHLTSRPA